MQRDALSARMHTSSVAVDTGTLEAAVPSTMNQSRLKPTDSLAVHKVEAQELSNAGKEQASCASRHCSMLRA